MKGDTAFFYSVLYRMLTDKFETANDSQCVEILKQSILDAIENYKNKNIPQQYIDVIVEKMKASINE